jgi:hypothetical protein
LGEGLITSGQGDQQFQKQPWYHSVTHDLMISKAYV